MAAEGPAERTVPQAERRPYPERFPDSRFPSRHLAEAPGPRGHLAARLALALRAMLTGLRSPTRHRPQEALELRRSGRAQPTAIRRLRAQVEVGTTARRRLLAEQEGLRWLLKSGRLQVALLALQTATAGTGSSLVASALVVAAAVPISQASEATVGVAALVEVEAVAAGPAGPEAGPVEMAVPDMWQ